MPKIMVYCVAFCCKSRPSKGCDILISATFDISSDKLVCILEIIINCDFISIIKLYFVTKTKLVKN